MSRVKEEIFVYITLVACFFRLSYERFFIHFPTCYISRMFCISRIFCISRLASFPTFSAFPDFLHFLHVLPIPQIPHATKQLRTSPPSVQAPLHTFRSSTPAYMLLKHRSPIVMAKCHIFVIILLLFRAQFRNNYSLNTLDGFRNLHSQNALHFQDRPLCSLDI